MILNLPIGRSKIFADRGAALFRSTVAVPEMAVATGEGKAILTRPTGYSKAPAKVGRQLASSTVHCGEKNDAHCPIAEAVAKGIKAGGYSQKQPAAVNLDQELGSVEPGAKACLSRWSGGLMAEMRRCKAW